MRRRRRGSLLVEHLAALMVVAVVVLWSVLVWRQYSEQVVPLAAEVEATYAATVAVERLAPGASGEQVVQVGRRGWQVSVTPTEIRVVAQKGGWHYAFTPGTDDD